MGIFESRIAIVTGGASGIGRAVGQQLAARGATVILADLDGARALETARVIEASGGKASGVEVDVTDPGAVRALVDDTARAHGRIDFMFNNAGVASIGEVHDMPIEDWNWMIDVNLRGVLHGVLAAYPVMVRQGFGHIVNTASVAGLAPTPMMVGYSTTKHAVVGLSTGLRIEAKRAGVRVSVVCPGIIDTPMLQANRVVSLDRAILDANLPMAPYQVDRCASDILRGVSNNRAIIVVTNLGKIGWWVARAAPWLFAWLATREIEKVRRLQRAPR